MKIAQTPLLAVMALLPVLGLADPSPTTTSPTTTHPASAGSVTGGPATTGRATSNSSATGPLTAGPTTTGTNPTIPDPTEELKVMTERLKLSANQQQAIKPILVAEFDQRKAIEDNKSLSAPQKHDQEGAVHRAALAKIKALFTPQQMALIEQGMQNPAPGPTNVAGAQVK